MTFVIYSFSFPPYGGSEGYCSSRFASALARAGHEVYVVAPDWHREMASEVYALLVDERIHITRAPIRASGLRSVYSRIRYFTHEYISACIPSSVRAVRKVLRSHPDSILVTRSSPIVSLIVGWMCRHDARLWIAHFSDPLSYLPRGTFWSELRQLSLRRWIDRAIRDADGISLTCENVKRYYYDKHGRFWPNAYSFITNHIGDPSLPCSSKYERDCPGKKLIVHAGLLNRLRGTEQILAAVRQLNESGFGCKFLQCGSVDGYSLHAIESLSQYSEIIRSLAPDMATAVCKKADAVIIADQDTDLGYIPFIPSKFAYQIFTETPIVVLSRADSEMAFYCKKYPEAGLFFAEIGSRDSLVKAIVSATSCCRDSIQRKALRNEFSQKGVVDSFVANVLEILALKKSKRVKS